MVRALDPILDLPQECFGRPIPCQIKSYDPPSLVLVVCSIISSKIYTKFSSLWAGFILVAPYKTYKIFFGHLNTDNATSINEEQDSLTQLLFLNIRYITFTIEYFLWHGCKVLLCRESSKWNIDIKKGLRVKLLPILQISIMHYPINNNDVFTISFSNNSKLFYRD